jgi:hypothetical protein
MTESDIRACKVRRITICPADTAILDTQTLTCESQLYLQSVLREQTCQRKLLVRYDTPTLVRYGNNWIYHFTTPSRLTSRCPQGDTWNIQTQTLGGAGIIENATNCELTTDGLRTIAELHGSARFSGDTPPLFPPLDVPISEREMPASKQRSHPVSAN